MPLIYNLRLYILIELPWLENSSNFYMRTPVSILLGLISIAYHDLHHWRANQQPQNAEAEALPLSHRSISHVSDAKLTSHSENLRPLDLMCFGGTYSRQTTRTIDVISILLFKYNLFHVHEVKFMWMHNANLGRRSPRGDRVSNTRQRFVQNRTH